MTTSEECPICSALVVDMYRHLIWHGEKPVGPRFRKRYEAELERQKTIGRALGWN